MPIVDVEMVGTHDRLPGGVPAASLASALGLLFGTPPGRTWVRLRLLPPDCYAENDAPLQPGSEPVFVTVLHARPPEGEARAAEARAITASVAACLGRDAGRVHVQYAPAAAGRQAFGGQLVP